MPKPRRKTHPKYKTFTCSPTAVEKQVNRLAAKGWVLSDMLLLPGDRVLVVCQFDTLADMTMLMQMRLQKYLDAYSRMFEMLSNVLRKIAATQTALIANLK